MSQPRNDRRWIFAILTAVLFPILVLHGTCIAVMGPGTWGAGVEELVPEVKPPTEQITAYIEELSFSQADSPPLQDDSEDFASEGIVGRLLWAHQATEGTVFLSYEQSLIGNVQHLYLKDENGLVEINVPADHLIVRPQWANGRIIYERWTPWAVPPMQKLLRYVSSWFDSSLRPEAALYSSSDNGMEWHYMMPGHSLQVAPDGQHAVFLRSGAMLANFYSIHIWDLQNDDSAVIYSMRNSEEQDSKSFSLHWTADSAALQVVGTGGGFLRRPPGGNRVDRAVNLIYQLNDQTVYELNP